VSTWTHPSRTHGIREVTEIIKDQGEELQKPWWAGWELEVESIFLFPGAFKTYSNIPEGKDLLISNHQ
jgi:hypothetical protein